MLFKVVSFIADILVVIKMLWHKIRHALFFKKGIYFCKARIFTYAFLGDYCEHRSSDFLSGPFLRFFYQRGPIEIGRTLPIIQKIDSILEGNNDKNCYAQITFTLDDEPYDVLYLNRVRQFPPFSEAYIADAAKRRMRPKMISAFATDANGAEHQVTDLLKKYAGPRGDFFNTLRDDPKIARTGFVRPSLKIVPELRDYVSVEIRDNRGGVKVFTDAEPFELPILAHKRE